MQMLSLLFAFFAGFKGLLAQNSNYSFQFIVVAGTQGNITSSPCLAAFPRLHSTYPLP